MAWTGDKNNLAPNIKQSYPTKVVTDKRNNVTRAWQTRRDNDTVKDISIKLIDIDTVIMKQLESLQIHVTDDGNSIKVPFFYASPEKWKSIQKDGYMRDYNGKIILPCIAFKRINTDKDQSMMNFNRYVKYSVIKLYSEKNRYTPFNVLLGNNVPINEVYDIVLPDYMVLSYHFIIWTEYIEQMNDLVERINFEAQDYWGEVRGFRFRVEAESFTHATEVEVNQDRMIKTEFDLKVNGYLLLDSQYGLDGNPTSTNTKWFTPKKILLGVETVSDPNFNPQKINKNNGKWQSQMYSNISSSAIIPPPPIVFDSQSEISSSI